MTELQMGLIGSGVFAVIGVLGYNKWQEYRHRKLVEQVLGKQHADVLLEGGDEGARAPFEATDDVTARVGSQPELGDEGVAEASAAAALDGGRIEPVLGTSPEAEAAAAAESVESVEAAGSAAEESVAAAAMPAPGASDDGGKVAAARSAWEDAEIGEPQHLLSPLVDYIAAIEVAVPVRDSQLLDAQREALARLRKPVRWAGYNESSNEWEPVVAGGHGEYRRLRIGLQLADRKGALDAADLSAFHAAMQGLAGGLMAVADLPPRQMALAEAAKLDEFCANVDIQIGINVISQGQPFLGTKLRSLAEAAGMAIDGEGRFTLSDEHGNVLYVMLNQEPAAFSAAGMRTLTTSGVTFLLDVPRVAQGEVVFNRMVEQARHFADALRGQLVDDNRRPLSESALAPIRRQIAQYQSLMAAQGLAAGAPLTQRLFS